MARGNELMFIRQIRHELRNYNEKFIDLINCSCPVCGDSKTNKYKARFYFIYDTKKGGYYVVCHNCQYNAGFSFFLKDYFPQVYRAWLADRFREGPNKTANEDILEKINNTDNIKKMDMFNDTSLLNKFCVNASENEIATQFYSNRKLPPEKLNMFYHTDRFGDLRVEINDKYKSTCSVNSLFIIPFYINKKLVGIQGRNYDKGSKLRYIFARFAAYKDHLIFNIDNIDTNKTIYLLEGTFDSLFFDNAIATNGTGFKNEFTETNKDNIIILPDNEKRNQQTLNNLSNIINDGFRVWLPSDNIIGKDINEMILNGITVEQIKSDIDNNTFSGLMAKLQFSKWKNS